MKIIRSVNGFATGIVLLSVWLADAAEDIEPTFDIGTVKIVSGDYPPYYGPSMPDGGPVAKIIMLACRQAKLDCEIEFLPWNRVLFSLDSGESDIAFIYARTKERLKEHVYSREFLAGGVDSVFFLKSKFPTGIHFSSYKDLVGYTMLGDSFAWYAEEFREFGVETVWLLANSNKWKMLQLGRADALLANSYQGLSELQEAERKSEDLKGKIGFTTGTIDAEDKKGGGLMFSKPHFDARKRFIRDALDRELATMDGGASIIKALDEKYSSGRYRVE